MARGRLFEYALLYHPKQTKDQLERGEEPKSEVIQEPKTVLATSEQQVSVLAARAIPADYVEQIDSVEIVVRPF
jgi:hypothetical protein